MADPMTRAVETSTTWEYDPMVGRPRVVHRAPNAADSQSVAARQPLSPEMLARMQRYWNAANYLTVGQIYLTENPLLREPLRPEQIKQRLLGHWGTSTGLSFIYVHVNRLIKETGADILYIAGPGHGGPALNACSYLEGTYSEVHPEITPDAAGMRLLFRQFSTPGGVPSHCGPHTPNSMHEGGELGYALVHAYGAAFDNPDLIVACVIGDGEAETGPLEGSWKGNKFLDPVRDGAVLPILHLNGYKISGPTVLARLEPQELEAYFQGHGYFPYFVEGDDPSKVHQWLAAALDQCYQEIRALQQEARSRGFQGRPVWPMIILRTPKGWTGPKEVDGLPAEGTFRAHQVPLENVRSNPEHLQLLEAWLRSYRPEEQFDANGRLVPELAALAPESDRRLGANPHVNGGRLTRELDLPAWADYGLNPPVPGQVSEEGTRRLGTFLRDIIRRNPESFRLFCPDETNSNRLNAVFEVTDRCSVAAVIPIDDHVAPDGRVMEVLNEHCCQGWLEGYTLTGRHGLWTTYEAFGQIVDSMLTQHVKWLKQCLELPWRRPVPSLNVLLSSHVWRQDHNGATHQAPGYVDNALVQKSTVVRAYFPPDANCLLSVMDHCLRSRSYVNVVTAGKQPQLQWLNVEEAREHCARGASIWRFASNDERSEPDVILACAGDVPTLETCAAAWLLRKHVPELKIRVVNVVDLFVLMSPDQHPHGMGNEAFASLFTEQVPVIFAYHGYPWVIHGAVHRRPNTERFHVHGYRDEGTTTTPFDMVVLNHLSRFHLAMDALRYVPRLRSQTADIVDMFNRKLEEHRVYTRENFVDLPEIAHWFWTPDFSDPKAPPPAERGSTKSFSDA